MEMKMERPNMSEIVAAGDEKVNRREKVDEKMSVGLASSRGGKGEGGWWGGEGLRRCWPYEDTMTQGLGRQGRGF